MGYPTDPQQEETAEQLANYLLAYSGAPGNPSNSLFTKAVHRAAEMLRRQAAALKSQETK